MRPGTKRAARRRSIKIGPGAAQRLGPRAAFLALQAPQLGAECRPGRAARRRPHRGGADQFDQPFQRIAAVALLGAVALGGDDEHAVAGQALAGQPLQPRPHLMGQRRLYAFAAARCLADG